ncbi:hypothetical protein HMI54_010403 [Coelomomyces lativittatus]|nr:hypothetical protein HMI54_010403 [Coelomomyces lativittatus]KAJ1515759.1 hypothetical protein HMI56_001277 [Coelomomyces lativittatus]
MYFQSAQNEKPQYYKLDWSPTTCCRRWVDYSQLISVDDSEGSLKYRSSSTCGVAFCLHRFSSNTFLKPEPKSFPQDSSIFFKAIQRKHQISLEYYTPPINISWFLRFSIRAPTFTVRYWGHTIKLTPSVGAGFWNRDLSLEARFIAPVSRDGQSMSNVVVFNHRRDTFVPTCSCSNPYTSRCSFFLNLIESLARSPAPTHNEVPFCSFNPPEHILNVDPEQLLVCFFFFVSIYHQYYASMKFFLPIFIFNILIAIGIIGLNIYLLSRNN